MRSLQTTKRWRNWFGNSMREALMWLSAYWTISSTGDAAIRCGRLRLQQAVAVSNSWPSAQPLRYGALRVRGSPCQSAPGRHDYGLRNNNQQDGSRSETSLRPDGRSEICSSRRRLCRQRRPVQEILSRGERCGQDSAGGCLHSWLSSASGSISTTA